MDSWARRWRALLDVDDPGVSRRRAQGRALQRSGRVSAVALRPGLVSARVQGSRATPHAVEIEVPVLDDRTWERVVQVLVGRLRHSAQLLAGQAPAGMEEELRATGVALFPRLHEVGFVCGCGDPAGFCIHAAAAWEEAAERIAADPFVLLTLRGRGRARLLGDLSAARRASAAPGEAAGGLAVSGLAGRPWGRAAVDPAELVVPPLDPPAVAAPVVRVLGDPPGWAGAASAWDLFSPLVAEAAEALDRGGVGPPPAQEGTAG